MVRTRTLWLAAAIACGAAAARPARGAGADGPPRAAGTAPVSPASAPATTTVRAVYIPESVKAEIREQIKQEVIAEFYRENWALPNTVPEWTRRIHFYGDVRIRYELDVFPAGNANTGDFPDFYAINVSKPFDVRGVDLSGDKYLDVDTNRSRFRLRARLGVEADAGSGFTIGIKIASGDQNSPISPNQTLGGSGGFFSRYQIWIDQAYIRYYPIHDAGGDLMLVVGRFENPFFTARDLLWSENVNLDGFGFLGAFAAGAGWRPFVVLGASPVYSTAFAYPVEQTVKYNSVNKWLFGAQLGTDFRPSDRVLLKLGAALYYFYKVSGVVSPPTCDTYLTNVTCTTDDTRPSFAQKGNTYIALRTPSPAALAQEAAYPLTTPRYEYFGLASQFQEVFATGKFDYRFAPATLVSLEGEFAWNAGYSKTKIFDAQPVNNCAFDSSGKCQSYLGGNYAYVARLTFGTPTEVKQWDWNASLAYLYIQSDALIDAFTNPDFGFGGTNLKGYWAGGRVALANNLTLGVRWMSADNIMGPTYRFDLLQVDFWGRF